MPTYYDQPLSDIVTNLVLFVLLMTSTTDIDVLMYIDQASMTGVA